MKRTWRWLIILLLLLGAGACQTGGGDSGGNQGRTDAQGTSQAFIDALLAGNFDTAKQMAPADSADLVSERVDQFAALAEKYEFQEVKIASTRAWIDGTGKEESDKRIEITFQYRAKGSDDRWRIGSVSLRALLAEGNTWNIANLQFVRPTS